MIATFNTDVKSFVSMIDKRAIVFGIGRLEAFSTECRLLAKELIERTPPFSGKKVLKMLAAQNAKVKDSTIIDIGEKSAMNVGKNAVEKDIKKVIYGVTGAAQEREYSAKPIVVTPPGTTKKQAKNISKQLTRQRIKFGKQLMKDGGYLQRLKGQDVVRVYATKGGEVYGVDTESFQPRASMADLTRHHQQNRLSRGRVTQRGTRRLDVGRWKFLNKLVTKAATLNKFIKKKQNNVGRAKAGWGAAFMRFGGRMSMSGWIGKHAMKTGRVITRLDNPTNLSASFVNQSEWTKPGDLDRIIPQALAFRENSLRAAIWRHMNDAWKKGGTVPR